MGSTSDNLNIVILDACRDNPLAAAWRRFPARKALLSALLPAPAQLQQTAKVNMASTPNIWQAGTLGRTGIQESTAGCKSGGGRQTGTLDRVFFYR